MSLLDACRRTARRTFEIERLRPELDKLESGGRLWSNTFRRSGAPDATGDRRTASCCSTRPTLDIQERLQVLSRPGVRHLERLGNALTAWAAEHRAPTAAALAYSAGVPARIGEALLSDLEQAGLIERDEDGHIVIAVPLGAFHAGARDLVAKLKTFRFEGERAASTIV